VDNSDGAVHYKGTTTTALSNGSTTNPITIDGEEYTAVFGDIAVYDYTEFVFDGTQWSEIGRPFDTTPTSGSNNPVTSDGINHLIRKGSSGYNTIVLGNTKNTSTGTNSLAVGYGTQASQPYMTAIGYWNKPRANDLFNIGCGAQINRRNIVEVNSTSMNVNGNIQRDGVGIDDYTTTERKIGKWIDGSDLYQRTFDNVTISGNDQWNEGILGTSGIEIVDFKGLCKTASDTKYMYPLNYYRDTGITICTCLNETATDINIHPKMPSSESYITAARITIQYIKPSVQANLMQTAPTEEVSETPTVEE
jgi:hypothetical protein